MKIFWTFKFCMWEIYLIDIIMKQCVVTKETKFLLPHSSYTTKVLDILCLGFYELIRC